MKNSSKDFLLPQIEFSNNGVSDSLTGAPAPKLFIENLTREISQSRRRSQELSIVTIKLLPETMSIAKAKNLEFEKKLVVINKEIKSNIRSGEFYSRIAENGFWIFMQGDAGQATLAAQRFEKKISLNLKNAFSSSHLDFSVSQWSRNLEAIDWIQEIDFAYFAKI